MCAFVHAVPHGEDRSLETLHLVRPVPEVAGCNLPKLLQPTQPNANKPKSLSWQANHSKPSFNVRISKEKLPSAKVGPGHSLGAHFGFGAFCFLKTGEEALSAFVWSHDQNDKKQAEHQANVLFFVLSRKHIPPFIPPCECTSDQV